ncbi:MAG: NAD(P)-dependent oxidoreductase [Deltaproteobacteria bacterium]|nr:NAD(P)-dependent oxidoreductase [Deltaproteobacteria bacterium]
MRRKDLKLALDSGRDLGADMGVTEAAHRLYDRARKQGLGDKVFFATLRALEEAAGVGAPPPRRG